MALGVVGLTFLFPATNLLLTTNPDFCLLQFFLSTTIEAID